jgi:AraC-like DNA-binding protein
MQPTLEAISERDPAPASVRAWSPPIPGIREVFHASFAEHAYPPHTHDAWTLFIVDHGAVRYDLHRHVRAAEPSRVSILPPHVAHDGRPATSDGYRMRVLYVETSVLGEELIGPAVDRPVVPDPSLRRAVASLHDALECRDDVLEAETRFAFVAERIRLSFGGGSASEPASSLRGDDLAEAFRAWLDARLFEPATLAAAASDLDASPTRMARAFGGAFGITPHAYVTARRLDAARGRILDGAGLADVAAEVGFVDQAHLTRRFRDFLGTTPGRFGSR